MSRREAFTQPFPGIDRFPRAESFGASLASWLAEREKAGGVVEPYPHRYSVAAIAGAEGDVSLECNRLPGLTSAAPAEFGGPGDRWSPETLCVSAVADCFVLTFRAIARASKLPWSSLRCDVDGTLDRVDRVAQFTAFLVRASLQVPAGTNEEQALRLLERAEKSCLITNSLKGASRLEAVVETR